MKQNILAILLVAVIALAFSGAASAATQQVLVKEAWDEQVLVSEAYDEEVIVEPEYNETVFNHYLVNGEYTKVIHHPAVYETVHHDAVYETVTVVDEEAYDEEVLVTPGYNESVEADHNGAWLNPSAETVFYWDGWKLKNKAANKYSVGYQFMGYEVAMRHNNCGNDKIWEAIFNIIQHPPVFETVHHDAVTHEEQVLVSEAWDEEVLVANAYDSYVQVPYSNNGPYFGVFPDWTDINTWAQWIAAQPDSTGAGWGSWTPFYKLINHPAVTELIHYDAVYETVHHAAEYITVEVIDPVVKPVAAFVAPPAEPKTVDMEETGTDFTLLYVALGALLAGLGLAALRRRKEE